MRNLLGDDLVVKLIRLGPTGGEGFVELLEGFEIVRFLQRVQSATDGDGFPRRDDEFEMRGGFGPGRFRRDRVLRAFDDVSMKGILGIFPAIFRAEDAERIGVVFREKPGHGAFVIRGIDVKPVAA